MRQNIKKYASVLNLLVFLPSLFVFSSLSVSAEGRKQTFVVTAYYSPCPNQKTYLRGYYEAEKLLNGNGTHGADGTPVYTGMLAAPKTYAFGTKIELPGLGVGEVHDRGGAIKSYNDYDRIDVWMGRCDEGLARALEWGKRTVEGTVYSADSEAQENLDFSVIPANVSALPATESLFSRTLFLGVEGDEVRSLQSHLKNLGFFDGSVTGSFDTSTEQAVINFQKSYSIVDSENSHGAGVIGHKSQLVLKKLLNNEISQKLPEAEKTGLESHPVQEETIPSVVSNAEIFSIVPGIGTDSSGSKVKRLQRILQQLGYFEGEFSEEYTDTTRSAVYAFQRDHSIVRGENDLGAGYFGNKTYRKLADVFAKRQQRREGFQAKEMSEVVEVKAKLVFGGNLQKFWKK